MFSGFQGSFCSRDEVISRLWSKNGTLFYSLCSHALELSGISEKMFSLTLSVVESDPFRAQEAVKCLFQSGED